MVNDNTSVQDLKPHGRELRLDLNRMTTLDVISIVLILLLAIGIILKTKLRDHLHATAVAKASIFHDGKLNQHIALDKNQEIVLLDGKMVIEVKDNRLRVKKSACPRQVCVNMGWVKHSGESIVCIPFKTLIEIKSSNRPVVDAVVF
jgi:hypothetical protein